MNNKLLELQQQIKNNSTDLNSYVNELANWTDDINEKEESRI